MSNIGKSARAIIEAKKKCNDPGLELASEHGYQFTPTGRWISLKRQGVFAQGRFYV
jgi:hypothetical protein